MNNDKTTISKIKTTNEQTIAMMQRMIAELKKDPSNEKYVHSALGTAEHVNYEMKNLHDQMFNEGEYE